MLVFFQESLCTEGVSCCCGVTPMRFLCFFCLEIFAASSEIWLCGGLIFMSKSRKTD